MDRTIIPIRAASGAVAMLAVMTQVRAGGDKVAFPRDYAQGVLYTSHDLAEEKEFREFYITPAAMAAARSGRAASERNRHHVGPLRRAARWQGRPVKDAGGRFIKSALKAFRVMEKGIGWGAEYPADLRNGEWEYQAFLPGGQIDQQVDLKTCLQCHRNGDAANFMFTADQLKAAAK